MTTMSLQDFIGKFDNKTEYALEENGYTMHVIFFRSDYEPSIEDTEYFKNRAMYWKESYLDEGSEAFFWPDKMQIAGVVKYGIIND